MKSLLSTEDSLQLDLLFWGKKWLRHKMMVLTSHRVTDRDAWESIYHSFPEISNINDISKNTRMLKKLGMDGVNVNAVPFCSFYIWILKNYDKLHISHITTDMVMEFLTINTSNKSSATKKNYRNVIGDFFSYVSKNNILSEENPISFNFAIDVSSWAGLKGSSGIKPPDSLTMVQLHSLLSRADNIKEYQKKEAQAFFSLLLRMIAFSGIRISEALGIHKKDIKKDKEHYIFLVKGKGEKERYVFIEISLIEAQYDYWLSVSPCIQTTLLFCSLLEKDGSLPASASSISHKISSLLKKEGILTKKSGAHLLRHTYATLIYEKTQDLVLLKDLLGHSSVSTTEIYTHVGDKKKRYASSVFIEK